MSDEATSSPFAGQIDLAAESFGGATLAASDDFFAAKENLLKLGRGIFIPDKYTDRGKWMDGWESRRKRDPGNDWCIIRLGAPGTLSGFDIDTNHFLGNHPPHASVEGLYIEGGGENENNLESANWLPILEKSELRAGSQNFFTLSDDRSFTHLRLSIYPDGGVARFRAYGTVCPTWLTHPDDKLISNLLQPNEVDLAAARNGGLAIECSNMFFSPMNNLLLPGRATNMGGGWETRRKREPGHDWIIIELAKSGTISFAEIDTNHFKGNFPDRFSLEGAFHPKESSQAFDAAHSKWFSLIEETSLQAHHQHHYRAEIQPHPAITHVRLNIIPDGGISRLRLYGLRDESIAR